MRVLSVPSFIGRRRSGFAPPEPAIVVAPDLPGGPGADYSAASTDGPGALPQQRMSVLYRSLAAGVAETGEPLV